MTLEAGCATTTGRIATVRRQTHGQCAEIGLTHCVMRSAMSRRKSRSRKEGAGSQRSAPARTGEQPSGLNVPQGELFPDLGRGHVEIARLERFVGPLPPPDMLADYDLVMSGLGATIVEYWTGEQKHRWAMDRLYASLDLAGLVCASVVALVCIIGGFYAITQGAEAAGITAVLAPIAAIVGAFLLSSARKEKERGREEESGEEKE